MQPQPAASLTPRQLIHLLSTQRKLWLAPTIAGAVLAAAYSLVAPRYWEASQALVVRQETAGATSPTPGKFADLFEMRTLQETILELAKSQQVVAATLNEVSRAATGSEPTPPTASDIEQFRKRLKMVPPDGGEFGKTEVFYFCVRDTNRDRAIQLVGALCNQLESGLRDLRAKRAANLIADLEQQVASAAQQHAVETKKLVEFESQIGSDLGELRQLQSAQSGQSDMRQEVVQVETDVRKFKTQVQETEQLVTLLQDAQKDPQTLIATPNTLLASQPALRRLKDGLVDAQLAAAKLAGTRSTDHPLVRAAAEAEKQIREDLHHELATAIQGAQVELKLGHDRLATAQSRLDNLQGRLSRLARERGDYSDRVAAVDNSRVSLDRARNDLSTAKAVLASAHSGSLVTRLDKPEAGPYPVGLGRTVITAAGGCVGFILGMGLVFLNVGPRSDRRQSGDRRSVPRPITQSTALATRASDARAPRPAPAPTNSQPVAAHATAPAVDDDWVAAPKAPAPPAVSPVANAAPARSQAAPQKAATPIPVGALAATSPLPPLNPTPADFSGMTLQQALQAAQRLQS